MIRDISTLLNLSTRATWLKPRKLVRSFLILAALQGLFVVAAQGQFYNNSTINNNGGLVSDFSSQWFNNSNAVFNGYANGVFGHYGPSTQTFVNNGNYNAIDGHKDIFYGPQGNAGNQEIAGSVRPNFFVLRLMNGDSSIHITNTNGANVRDSAIFANGITTTVRTNHSNGALRFDTSAVYAGDTSDTRHVNGYVSKVGTSAFSFPIGSGTDLRTLSISAPAAVAEISTAWFAGSPATVSDPSDNATHSITALAAPLTAISPVGFWDWIPVSGSDDSLTVTVSIPDVSSFAPAAELRLAGWNGTQWVNLSGTNGANVNTQGGKLTGRIPAAATAPGWPILHTDDPPQGSQFNCQTLYISRGATNIVGLVNDSAGNPLMQAQGRYVGNVGSPNTAPNDGFGFWMGSLAIGEDPESGEMAAFGTTWGHGGQSNRPIYKMVNGEYTIRDTMFNGQKRTTPDLDPWGGLSYNMVDKKLYGVVNNSQQQNADYTVFRMDLKTGVVEKKIVTLPGSTGALQSLIPDMFFDQSGAGYLGAKTSANPGANSWTLYRIDFSQDTWVGEPFINFTGLNSFSYYGAAYLNGYIYLGWIDGPIYKVPFERNLNGINITAAYPHIEGYPAGVQTPPNNTPYADGFAVSDLGTCALAPVPEALNADVSIVKDGPASVIPNDSLSYQIVVTNNGPDAADSVTVTDPATTGFTATGVTCADGGGATAGCPTNLTVSALQGSGLVIPTLPAGSSVVFTVTGTAGAADSISNRAAVALPPGVVDSIPGNNRDTVVTKIAPACAGIETVYELDPQATLAAAGTIGANGGTVNLVYKLTSGDSIPGLGSQFTIPLRYTDFRQRFTGSDHTWSKYFTFDPIDWGGGATSTFCLVPNTTSLFAALPANNRTQEPVAAPNYTDNFFTTYLQNGRLDQLGTFDLTIGDIPALPAGVSLKADTFRIFSSNNLSTNGNGNDQAGWWVKPVGQNKVFAGSTAQTVPLKVPYGGTYTYRYSAFTDNSTFPGADRGVVFDGKIVFCVPSGGPDAVNDTATTIVNTPVRIPVVSNDSSKIPLDTPSVAVTQQPGNGTVAADSTGALIYTPNNGFTGRDSLQYTVKDSAGVISDTATVYVTVNPEPPCSSDAWGVDNKDIVRIKLPSGTSTRFTNVLPLDFYSIAMGKDGKLYLLSNVQDAPSYTMRVFDTTTRKTTDYCNNIPGIGISGAYWISGASDRDGNIYFISNLGQKCIKVNPATCEVTYLWNGVIPSTGLAGATYNSETVNFTMDVDGNVFIVNAVNKRVWKVSRSNDYASAAYVGAITGLGSLGISDIVFYNNAGAREIYVTTTGNIHKVDTATLAATPLANAVTVDDAATSPCMLGTILTGPRATNDSALTDQGVPVTIPILNNDTAKTAPLNPDSVTITQQPAHGTVTVDTAGRVVYTPDSTYTGRDSLLYTVKDTSGQISNIATVYITIDSLPPTFSCTVSTGYLLQNSPTDAFVVNLSTGSFALAKDNLLGNTGNTSLNAVGFNVKDNYLWAFRISTNQLVRIASDWSVDTFDIAGLAGSGGFNVGDINANGIHYLYASNSTFIYRVDLNPASPTYKQTLPRLTTTATNIADWAFSPKDNNLYGVDNNTWQLYRFNPNTGARTVVGTVSGGGIQGTTAFGAAYMDNDGALYVSSNVNGHIFKIANPHTGGLTAVLAAKGPISGGNDGARCPLTPILPRPYAVNDTTTTGQGQPVTIPILNNDTTGTAPFNPDSVTITQQPQHGTVTVDTAGRVVYTPDSTYIGKDSLLYTVKDTSDLVTNVATVYITIDSLPPTFTCVESTGYLFQGDPTSAYIVNLGTGESTLAKSNLLGTGANVRMNALGYNPVDKYVWGVRNFTQQIVRIGSNWSVDTFTVAGLPANNNQYVGDVNANGIIYLYEGNTSTIYRVDLNPSSTNYLKTLPTLTTTASVIHDWAFSPIDSNLYTITGDNTFQLLRFNPATGQRTNLGAVTGGGIQTDNQNSAFGAVYMDSEGSLYISANVSGKIYKIVSPNTGNTTAIFVTNGPKSDNNDGARCPLTPIIAPPLAVNDSARTEQNTPVDIPILGNDTARTSPIDSSSVDITRQPENGTVTVDSSGQIRYTPDSGYVGIDSLRYTIKDRDSSLSNEATVYITIDSLPPAFACERAIGYLIQNDPSDAYIIDLATGVASLAKDNLLGNTNARLNAIGYNPKDNFLWAHHNLANEIVRIASDWSVTRYQIAGMVANADFNVGDVNANGILYMTLTNTATIERVDVNPTSPNYLKRLAPLTTTAANITDWAFSPIDSNLYAISNAGTWQLFRYNPATGARTTVGTVSGGGIQDAANVNFGAAYMDNEGSLFVSNNETGNIYKIASPHTGGTTATFIVKGPLSGNNDGARCPSTPIVTEPPIAANDTATTRPNTPVDLPVVDNDTATANPLDPDSVTITQQPLHGTATVNPDGTVTYTPNAGYIGLDFFRYTVKDTIGIPSNAAAGIIFIQDTLPGGNPIVCATPGSDGPVNNANPVNTYYPPVNGVMSPGDSSVVLNAVPAKDAYGNSFGTVPIKNGDLLMIVQMQDAQIADSNSRAYGSGLTSYGRDTLGATGFMSLGSTGRAEYVVATSNVPLTGGTLTFKGSGTSGGTVNTYTQAAANATRGERTYQVVRVAQYSNLTLDSNIITPPFNGKVGGVIVFDVAGKMDLNGNAVDGSARGFRGGYSLRAGSGNNISSVYAANSTSTQTSGKGEGIAGTPRYMWDGFNQVDNTIEGLPGGSFGKGAPANAGGGGSDHNAGGGGGGNGGIGGRGGLGLAFAYGTDTIINYPNGGRGGHLSFFGKTPTPGLFTLGGGGGGGDANDATTGTKGGVGGGIIIIRANSITGTGSIRANGGNGAPGVFGGLPDGAGGGGAGGTIFLNVLSASPDADITIEAKGGNGGNTQGDGNPDPNSNVSAHGPGGGAGGGIILYNIAGATVTADADGGVSGKSNDGQGITHGADGGTTGVISRFTQTDLPTYLTGGGGTECFPALTTTMSEATPTVVRQAGDTAVYTIRTTNTQAGYAGNTQIFAKLAPGFTFKSATVAYVGGANGPVAGLIDNSGSSDTPSLGTFNIPQNGTVIITLIAQIADTVPAGTYHGSAQAIYPDPTRSKADSLRKITAAKDAFPDADTSYADPTVGTVPGFNYNGNLPASDTENVIIGGAPIAVMDTAVTTVNTPVTIPVLSNDSATTAPLDSATVTITQQPAHGTITTNPNGTVVYTPDDNYTGPDTAKYTVKDTSGATSNVADIVINIRPTEPPVAVNDSTTTPYNTPATINLIANDTARTSLLDSASIVITTQPVNGTISVNPDGTVTYTPNNNYSGPDSAKYTVKDTSGRTSNIADIIITITPPTAEPPVARNDSATTPVNTPVTIDPLTNDSTGTAPLDSSSVTVVDPPNHGTATPNPDGTITYTPEPGYTGPDTLQYIVKDTSGLPSDTADIIVNVTPAPPIAVDDRATTPYNTPVTINAVVNDTARIGTIDNGSIDITQQPANGTITVNPDGTVLYTPNTGYSGTDTAKYTLEDSGGRTSNVANIIITIEPPTPVDPPDAVDDNTTTPVNTPVTINPLTNDTTGSAPLDSGTVTIVRPPTNGTATPNPDGTITYTPDNNFTGQDTLQYVVKDTSGLSSDTALVIITIEPGTPQAPIAVDDSTTTPYNTPATINLIANDTARNSVLDSASIVITTQPVNGTISVNPDGTVTYTPNNNYSGKDSAKYTVKDTSGLTSNIADIIITITPPTAEPPIARDDSATTPVNTPVTIDPLTNDSTGTAPLDSSSVTVVDPPNHGTATPNPDGTITYTPEPGYTGPDTLQYIVKDTSGLPSDTAEIVITITPAVQQPPIAVNDSTTTPVNTPVTGNVLTNDSDPNGDALTASLVTAPVNGTVVLNADGSFTYTPNNNFTGIDSLIYQVCDNGTPSLCDTATLFITIVPGQPDPIAVDDRATTPVNTPVTINVVVNDTAKVGAIDNGSVRIITQPEHGTISVQPDGTVIYTPETGYTGMDTARYTVNNTNGDTSNIANIIITIEPSGGQPPIAVDDNATTPVNTPVTINPVDNDTPGTNPIDSTSVTVVDPPGNGTVTPNPDGTIDYTPNPGYTGPDTIKYIVKDTSGLPSDTAVIIITVTPATPQAPIAVDDSTTTPYNTPVTINQIVNDTAKNSLLDSASIVITTQPQHGTISVNPDGTVVYTPDNNYSGPDTARYTVKDTSGLTSNIADVIITIEPSGVEPPIAVDDSTSTPSGTPVTINPVDNDTPGTNPIDSSSVTVVDPPGNGTVTPNPDGTITYTPNPGYTGPDTIKYIVKDTSGLPSDTAVIIITVTPPVIEPPIAVDDSTTTPYNTPVTINLIVNDTAKNSLLDSASIVITTQPQHGTISVNPDGTVVYTPNNNYSGQDTARYTVKDTSGLTSNIANIIITIVPPTVEPPIAVDDSVSTPGGTPVTINPVDNDTPGTNPIDSSSVTVVDPPSNGTATPNPDGTIDYTPNPGYTGPDTIKYIVKDTSGLPSDTAVIIVTVTPPVVPDPIAVDDRATTPINTPVTINVVVNDTAKVGSIDNGSIRIITQPEHGTISVQPDGTVIYTPETGYTGMDTAQYTVKNTNGDTSNVANIIITIEPSTGTEPPIAVDDNTTTPVNTPVTINPVDNDTPGTDPIDSTSVTVVDPPANGTVTPNPDGTITYTPDPGYTGPDTIRYTVKDTSGLPSDTANIIITVTPGVPQAPIAVDDSTTTPYNTPVTINLIVNDTAKNSLLDSASIVITTQPQHGTISVSPDGTVEYTPDNNYSGRDSAQYTVKDTSGLTSNIAYIIITITPPTVEPPIAVDDSVSTPGGTPVTINPVDNDTPGTHPIDSSSVTIVDPPTNGTVTPNPDGTIDYTPKPGYTGPDTIKYIVKDTSGLPSDTAVIIVTVTPPAAQPPIAVDDNTTTPYNTPATINLIVNDTAKNSLLDSASIVITTQPQHGTISVQPDGTVVYTPENNYSGPDSAQYTVKDTSGQTSNVADIRVIITPPLQPEPPIAVNDTITVDPNGPTTIDPLDNDTPGTDPIDSSSVTIVDPPTNGSATPNSDGTITYMPKPGYSGPDTIKYVVKDNNGRPSDTVAIIITVTPPVGQPPIAVNDTADTQVNTPVEGNVNENDSDPDNDPLAFNLVTPPAHGSVTLNTDGTFTYTPNNGYTGPDEFAYRVCDGTNQPCDTARVIINVRPVIDLVINVTQRTPQPVNTGDYITYEVEVHNASAVRATGVLVSNVLPALLNAPRDIKTQRGTATYVQANHLINWTIGDLTANERLIMTVTARAISNGTMNDSATVTGNEPELVTTNNEDGIPLTVQGEDLFIPNTFTPNGDGMNDRFVIQGLSRYQNPRIEVFNRWGNQVYRSNNYSNDWTGEGLSEGTYWYILRVVTNGQEKVFKGWVELLR